MLPGQIGILVLAIISIAVLGIMGLCSYNTYKKEQIKARKMASRAKAAAAMKAADEAYAEELARQSEAPVSPIDDPMAQPTPIEDDPAPQAFFETEPRTTAEPKDGITDTSLDDFMRSIGADTIDPDKIKNTKSDFTEFKF